MIAIPAVVVFCVASCVMGMSFIMIMVDMIEGNKTIEPAFILFGSFVLFALGGLF